jgi:DNA-binding LytR/AlgR family response regulator
MRITCIIIDDEPSSQKVLEKFIAQVDFLQLKGICNDAVEGLQKLNEESVDLMFLDINMPKITGLSFLKSLKAPPEVIITTAYSKYALEGFELSVVDYLLKPFSFDRFFTAVNKVVEKITHKRGHKNEDPFILIRSDKTLHKIPCNTVLFVEAYGDYVKIHLEEQSILTNSTFTAILDLLPGNKFVRTHKSFAVNIEKLNSISGNQIAIGKHKVPVGYTFKTSFLEFLNNCQ